MLEHTIPGIKELMFSRTQLQETLKEMCKSGSGIAHVVYRRGEGVRQTVKTLYHITDAPAMDEVRHRMEELRRLEQTIRESPYLARDLDNERGLWLPAVADAEGGDTQVNVAISENWTSKRATWEEIAEEMIDAEGAPAHRHLADYGRRYREFALCRRSGSTCRVAIRNPSFTDASGQVVGRLVWSINDFCIVLGEVPINFPLPPGKRTRHKRSDAWMGVDPPLFTYRAARGRIWEVHPPREGEPSAQTE